MNNAAILSQESVRVIMYVHSCYGSVPICVLTTLFSSAPSLVWSSGKPEEGRDEILLDNRCWLAPFCQHFIGFIEIHGITDQHLPFLEGFHGYRKHHENSMVSVSRRLQPWTLSRVGSG